MRPRPANSKLGFPHAGLMQAGPAGTASSHVRPNLQWNQQMILFHRHYFQKPSEMGQSSIFQLLEYS